MLAKSSFSFLPTSSEKTHIFIDMTFKWNNLIFHMATADVLFVQFLLGLTPNLVLTFCFLQQNAFLKYL